MPLGLELFARGDVDFPVFVVLCDEGGPLHKLAQNRLHHKYSLARLQLRILFDLRKNSSQMVNYSLDLLLKTLFEIVVYISVIE